MSKKTLAILFSVIYEILKESIYINIMHKIRS